MLLWCHKRLRFMVHFTRACKTLLSKNNKTRLTFEKQQEKNKNIICRPWSVRFSQYGPPGRQIIYISLSAVQICDYFIYSSSFLHLRDKYELTIDQLPVGLIAQLVRALHQYRRGHGFRFPFEPEFFKVSSFQLLKLKHFHCNDIHIIQ